MLDDSADERRDPPRVVEVWECNQDAVRAFQLCPIGGIGGGMGGVLWIGIGPEAIRAAVALLRIPRRDWPELAEDVGYMGRCVAAERSKQAAARKAK